MVVFEVIGRLSQPFVRAFMIAAERNRWTSLSPKRGVTLYKPDEIVLGMAERYEDAGFRSSGTRSRSAKVNGVMWQAFARRPFWHA